MAIFNLETSLRVQRSSESASQDYEKISVQVDSPSGNKKRRVQIIPGSCMATTHTEH